ncbi:MAG TPA: FecR domain-containing protein [Rhizomicrobium sp.]|jgi:transmembrane sensor
MNDNSEDDLPLSAIEEAADWLDRQEDMPAGEQAEFRDWLASPEHARAYAILRTAMSDTALLDASRSVAAVADASPVRRRLIDARSLGWFAAGLAAAAAIVVALLVRTPVQAPGTGRDFATTLRQLADWHLADNSHLYLNADSRVRVTYQRDARDLSLIRGEAIFEVAKDPKRPFHVTAHAVTVTAVGTMFGVDLMNDAVGVRVYHGVVTVAQGGSVLTLHKGDWLTLDTHLGANSGHFDPATYQNWRTDWLEADKMPLPYVVAKLNHYSSTPIVIEDSALNGAVLSGRFQLSNTDATLRLIAAALDINQQNRNHRVYLMTHHS